MDTQTPRVETPAPNEVSYEDVDFEKTAIPEGYKDSPVGKYSTVGELAKGYGEATKLIGAKGAIVPGENAKPEEYDKFYSSIGRPEKAEDYKLTPINNLHPDLGLNSEVDKGFRALIHKHGLTSKQADGFYQDYFSGLSNALNKKDEESGAKKHEAEKTLRTEWGGEYDNNLNKAKRLIDKFGGKEGGDAFGELGNNPSVLKTLANISHKFSEDGFIKGNVVTDSEIKDSQLKLDNIMLDKAHPYWVKGPGHTEAVAEVKRLNTIISPEVEV